jgi:hypothetical protein
MLDSTEEIYDIGRDVWLVAPSVSGSLPVDAIRPALETAADAMHRIESYIGNAKKEVIDYNLLKSMLSNDNAGELLLLLDEKMKSIDVELQKLKDEYKNLKHMRHDAFDSEEPLIPGANKNYTLGNIIFKLIERYKYMDVLRNIQKLTDSRPLTSDQVPEVAKIIGVEADPISSVNIEKPKNLEIVSVLQEVLDIKNMEHTGKVIALTAQGETMWAELDTKQFTKTASSTESFLLEALNLIKSGKNRKQIEKLVELSATGQGKTVVDKILNTWKWAEEVPVKKESFVKKSTILSLKTTAEDVKMNKVTPEIKQESEMMPEITQSPITVKGRSRKTKKSKWKFHMQRNAEGSLEDVIAEQIEE